jgi:hypothetical protein
MLTLTTAEDVIKSRSARKLLATARKTYAPSMFAALLKNRWSTAIVLEEVFKKMYVNNIAIAANNFKFWSGTAHEKYLLAHKNCPDWVKQEIFAHARGV